MSYRERGKHWSQFLDLVGDGSGSINMAVDGSITPVEFKCTPSNGDVYIVDRMIVSVQDVGTFDSGAYGNAIVLTNGIDLKIVRADESVEQVIDPQRPVKTNACWAAYCYDITLHPFGSGDPTLAVRWTFVKDGLPIVLNRKDSLIMTIRDSLVGLTNQNVRLGIVKSTA